MTRQQALASAIPDALGLRWAACQMPERTYVAQMDAGGRVQCQVRGRESPRALRTNRAPRHGWKPLLPVIKENP